MNETDETGLVRTCKLSTISFGHVEESSYEYIQGYYLNNSYIEDYLSITRSEHYAECGENGGTFYKEVVETNVVHDSSPQIQCSGSTGPYFYEAGCYFEATIETP